MERNGRQRDLELRSLNGTMTGATNGSSEMPDRIQEFMEDYIPEFVPANLRHQVDYFFLDRTTPKRSGWRHDYNTCGLNLGKEDLF